MTQRRVYASTTAGDPSGVSANGAVQTAHMAPDRAPILAVVTSTVLLIGLAIASESTAGQTPAADPAAESCAAPAAAAPARTISAPADPAAAGESEFEGLLKEFGRDYDRTRAASAKLAAMAPESIPFLVEHFDLDETKMRYEIVQTLDRIASPETIPALVERLVNDPSDHVRYRAMSALLALAEGADESRRTIVGELRQWHEKDDADLRFKAAFGLAYLGVGDVLDDVEAGLGATAKQRQFEAVWALAYIHDEETATLLAPFVTRYETSDLWCVLDTLEAIPGAAADAALRGALELEVAESRRRAARALKRRGHELPAGTLGEPSRFMRVEREPWTPQPHMPASSWAPPTMEEAELEKLEPTDRNLMKKLVNPDSYSRWDAVNGLGMRKARFAIPYILETIALARALSDASGEWHFFFRAIWALNTIRAHDVSIPMAHEILARQTGRRERWNMAVTIAHLGAQSPEVIDVLLDAITNSDNRQVRGYSIASLMHARSDIIFEVAEAVFDGELKGMHGAVRGALGGIKSNDPRIVSGLVYFLDHRGPGVRWRAAMNLGFRASAVSALERRLTIERERNPRNHIREALNKAGKKF